MAARVQRSWPVMAAAAEVARTSVQAAIQNVTVQGGGMTAASRSACSASHAVYHAARAQTAARVRRVALDTLRVGTVGVSAVITMRASRRPSRWSIPT